MEPTIENDRLRIVKDVFSPENGPYSRMIQIVEIPLSEINYIVEFRGPRGGLHFWNVYGHEILPQPILLNGVYSEKHRRVFTFSKGTQDILESTKQLLNIDSLVVQNG